MEGNDWRTGGPCRDEGLSRSPSDGVVTDIGVSGHEFGRLDPFCERRNADCPICPNAYDLPPSSFL
jgi:hypothetical protein